MVTNQRGTVVLVAVTIIVIAAPLLVAAVPVAIAVIAIVSIILIVAITAVHRGPVLALLKPSDPRVERMRFIGIEAVACGIAKLSVDEDRLGPNLITLVGPNAVKRAQDIVNAPLEPTDLTSAIIVPIAVAIRVGLLIILSRCRGRESKCRAGSCKCKQRLTHIGSPIERVGVQNPGLTILRRN